MDSETPRDPRLDPIGVFDSGIGGLTVAAAVKKLLPSETIFYIGDTARVLYGGKSRKTVERYSVEIGGLLLAERAKIIVVACNTASALAVPRMKELFNVPVQGVVSPGAEAAIRTTQNGRIGVIGTRATIASGACERAIHAIDPKTKVFSDPCPLLVPLIEEGMFDDPITDQVIARYLAPPSRRDRYACPGLHPLPAGPGSHRTGGRRQGEAGRFRRELRVGRQGLAGSQVPLLHPINWANSTSPSPIRPRVFCARLRRLWNSRSAMSNCEPYKRNKPSLPVTRILSESEWHARRDAHEARVRPWVEPRLARMSLGQRHPVEDFLFEYYSYRPGQLLRWHGGLGFTLEKGDDYLPHKGYVKTERRCASRSLHPAPPSRRIHPLAARHAGRNDGPHRGLWLLRPA